MTTPKPTRLTLALAAVLAALLASACAKVRSTGAEGRPECQRCHGGQSGNAAPPAGLHGEAAATDRAVGAHQAHLVDGPFRKAVLCSDCHVVPETVEGHGLKSQAAVTFSALATLHGTGTWDAAAATCSTYCHGPTLIGAAGRTAPIWNAPGSVQCGSCHGLPPAGHLSTVTAVTQCHACHSDTVKEDGTIDLAGGHHVDGTIDVDTPTPGTCNTCHPAVPTTGAHTAHVRAASAYGRLGSAETLDPTGAAGGYVFGCGNCHPTDAARHDDGVLDVVLSPAGAAAGSLKAMNGATAAYDKATGTCSNVYCHSSGQATPAFVTTPGWNSGTHLACSGCHGDPPAYANGGPGAATANSHIFLNSSGRESGHFAGLAGPVHGSRHGAATAFGTSLAQASPLTCQTCHADTVDPSNVATGGFFYLDTGITTQLAGGSPDRFASASWRDTQCVTCHKAGGAPEGAGKVLPRLHVNGRRDVTFDRRTTPPATWLFGAALGTATPAYPYFTSRATLPPGVSTLPAGAAFNPGGTLSFELSGATWAADTQTCTVACHLARPVRWGQKDFEVSPQVCTGCHGN